MPDADPNHPTGLVRRDLDESHQTLAKPDFSPPGQAISAQVVTAEALKGVMPGSPGELTVLSVVLAKSTIVPTYLRNKPESVYALVMAGLEIGLAPMRAINNLLIISGNLGMKADLQLAQCRRSGLMADYYEEFEIHDKTDLDQGALAERVGDTKLFNSLVAKLADLPHGKPYGWCVAQRKGESRKHIRVFSWLDAERAFTYSDDGGGGPKKKTKLSEKFNYQSWPQSMYPRRARSQILALLFSDVLAGIPSAEAIEGGQIIEMAPDDTPTQIEDMIAAIATDDSEIASGIVAGFEALDLSIPKQILKLQQFKNCPADLLTWLRTEHATRGGNTFEPKAELSKKEALAKFEREAAETIAKDAERRARDLASSEEEQAKVSGSLTLTKQAPATLKSAKREPEPEPEPSPDERGESRAEFEADRMGQTGAENGAALRNEIDETQSI